MFKSTIYFFIINSDKSFRLKIIKSEGSDLINQEFWLSRLELNRFNQQILTCLFLITRIPINATKFFLIW